MEWIESIREAISYIEDNITKDLSIKEIADRVNISPFYFPTSQWWVHLLTIKEYKEKKKTPKNQNL